jgi:hypothetical protein
MRLYVSAFIPSTQELNARLTDAFDAYQPEDGSPADKVLQTFDLIFVVLFTVELGINMFGNLWLAFFMDGWNYFDTFVVIVSLVATFADENPGLVSTVCAHVYSRFGQVRPDALSDALLHDVSAECVTDGSSISRLSALPTAQVAGPDYGTPLIHGLHKGLKFVVLAAGIEGCDCLAWRGRVLLAALRFDGGCCCKVLTLVVAAGYHAVTARGGQRILPGAAHDMHLRNYGHLLLSDSVSSGAKKCWADVVKYRTEDRGTQERER